MTSASIATTAPAARRIVLADLLPGERTRDVLLVLAAAAFVGAIAAGLTPFLMASLVKILLAAALLPTAWRLVGR